MEPEEEAPKKGKGLQPAPSRTLQAQSRQGGHPNTADLMVEDEFESSSDMAGSESVDPDSTLYTSTTEATSETEPEALEQDRDPRMQLLRSEAAKAFPGLSDFNKRKIARRQRQMLRNITLPSFKQFADPYASAPSVSGYSTVDQGNDGELPPAYSGTESELHHDGPDSGLPVPLEDTAAPPAPAPSALGEEDSRHYDPNELVDAFAFFQEATLSLIDESQRKLSSLPRPTQAEGCGGTDDARNTDQSFSQDEEIHQPDATELLPHHRAATVGQGPSSESAVDRGLPVVLTTATGEEEPNAEGAPKPADHDEQQSKEGPTALELEELQMVEWKEKLLRRTAELFGPQPVPGPATHSTSSHSARDEIAEAEKQRRLAWARLEAATSAFGARCTEVMNEKASPRGDGVEEEEEEVEEEEEEEEEEDV
jgi:hypothetical protein